MITDFFADAFCVFDGAKSTPIDTTSMVCKENLVHGKNWCTNQFAINTFLCIIHFGSTNTYTIPNRKDVIMKECTSFIRQFPKILTKTKMLKEKRDMYAIVTIVEFAKNVLYCEVIPNGYLGFTDEPKYENMMMELVCTAHWKNTKKTALNFSELKLVDLTPDRFIVNQSEVIYSIDPEGCRDIDDALHCKFDKEKQEYEIGIHIADPSSYIAENSICDVELKTRVETVYDYNKSAIHMIPEDLSINCISLLENANKRAFSIFITLDSNCKIIRVDFKKTIISVKKNLTYDEAQNMISTDENIANLYNVGLKLKEQIPNSFSVLDKYDTHQMVAVYMIYANKLTGEKIQSHDPNNVILRSHTNTHTNNYQNNDVSTNLIEKHRISKMEQAKYQIGTSNCYHGGLNLEYYTHMTSPIRRYVDIMVHRQLWKIINNEPLNEQQTKQNVEIVFFVNFYKKMFKQMERYMRIIECLPNIHQKTNGGIFEAYITCINTNNASIRIFIPELNIDHDLQLFHKKMKHIMKIDSNCVNGENIEIVNVHDNTQIMLSLFQKIDVKVIPTTEPFTVLRFEIV